MSQITTKILGLLGKVGKESTPNMSRVGALPNRPSDPSMSTTETSKDHEVDEHIAKKPRLSAADDSKTSKSSQNTPQYDVDEEMLDMRDDSDDDVDITSNDPPSIEQSPQHLTTVLPSQQGFSKKRKLDDIDSFDESDDSIDGYDSVDNYLRGRETSSSESAAAAASFPSAGVSSNNTQANGPPSVSIVAQASSTTSGGSTQSSKQKQFDMEFQKHYKTHHEKTLFTIDLLLQAPLSTEDSKILLESLKLLSNVRFAQYLEATKKRTKSPNNNVPHPRTAEEIALRFKGSEEDKHPLLPTPESYKKLPKYVIRTYHDGSQSKISDSRVGFQSRKSYGSLETKLERHTDIKNHLTWSKNLSPFISTSRSLAHIFRLFVEKNKGKYRLKGNPDNNKIVLINVRARLAAKKPIFSAMEEFKYHEMNLAGKEIFIGDEYLCPYEIGPDEIVCIWTLAEVEEWMNASGLIPRHLQSAGPRRYRKQTAHSRDRQAAIIAAAKAFQQQVMKPAYKKHEKERLEALAHP